MSENLSVPYVLQLKDAVNAIHLSENDVNSVGVSGRISLAKSTNVTFVPSYDPGIEVCMQPVPEIIQKTDTTMEIESQSIANGQVNFLYEVVYPEQLNLKPVLNLKRGRPKKKKVEKAQVEAPKVVKTAPRTRSGRIVRFPKHIEKDFEKVEIEDDASDDEDSELKTSEFISFVDDKHMKKTSKIQLEFHQRKRKISAQYRCPKCNKAYLGKTKMIQHIRKYPDHGPVPLPQNELNFEVWNYLVDITQKCPQAQRGIKFCEELTNLLHNVLLLTSALFKKAELNKNHVDVDKVLGNAIGLPPGTYKFNDSELYKDVTVLKLITNSDFFKPISRDEDFTADVKSNREIQEESKEQKDKQQSVLPSNVVNVSQDASGIITSAEIKDNKGETCFNSPENAVNFSVNKTNVESIEINYKTTVEASTMRNFSKKEQDNRISVQSDLLSDNSLLNLPNLRNSVDELILSGVDSGTHLLDNSTSSDEVMNVDQFVNERFKKITEPEIDMSAGGLNLDLPSLDLFQFHTS